MGRATTRVAPTGLGGFGGDGVRAESGWKYIFGFMGGHLLAPACRLSSHLQSACRTPAEPPARHLQNTCIYLKTPARRKIFSGGRGFHIAGFIFPTPNSDIRGIYVLYATTIGQRVEACQDLCGLSGRGAHDGDIYRHLRVWAVGRGGSGRIGQKREDDPGTGATEFKEDRPRAGG